MIDIKLVKVTRNGVTMLVGRTFQDRWNLESLGIKTGIKCDRNQSSVKTMRRRLAGLFTVSVVRNGERQEMNHAELGMMSPAFRAVATLLALAA